MKIKKAPYPNYMLITQFFWLQFIQPGIIHEMPSSTNWMKLWRYITLELKQSCIWFIPNFKEEIFVKVFQKRWSKGDMMRVLKRDYAFYDFDDRDFNSIITILYSNLEKHKRDWLIIKCDFDFVEKNREQLQKIANDLNTRVVLITSSNISK
jgi:hypothetical protein